jgi:hypothetical protein
VHGERTVNLMEGGRNARRGGDVKVVQRAEKDHTQPDIEKRATWRERHGEDSLTASTGSCV